MLPYFKHLDVKFQSINKVTLRQIHRVSIHYFQTLTIMKTILILLILASLSLALDQLVSYDPLATSLHHENATIYKGSYYPDEPFINWGTVGALINGAGWIWNHKAYVASCGVYSYGTTKDPNTGKLLVFYVNWAWIFTKGTYVVYLDMTNPRPPVYSTGCQAQNTPFQPFENSEYNVLESIASCESGMDINNNIEQFTMCLGNIFGSKTLSDCAHQCLFGCPSNNCQ
jgi:hypothetical protein